MLQTPSCAADRPTIALVLETHNLEGGGAGPAEVAQSLSRLLRHLGQQTLPLSHLAELVVTHRGLQVAQLEALRRQAGEGVPLRFVQLPTGAGYYQAKNVGFAHSAAEVVVFGDTDCWPDPAWLEELVRPLAEDPDLQVVAGRTTYRDGTLGAAATAIDFMYFPSTLGEGNTRNFYANNVAFRRGVFSEHPFPERDGVYRGHCQLLGARLEEAGIAVRFAPDAITVHRLPDQLQELLELRLLRGADAAELAPAFVRSYAPSWARGLERSRLLAALAVMAVRLGSSTRWLAHAPLGGRPGRSLEQAGDPARWLLSFAGMALISALDTGAALGRALGLEAPERRARAGQTALGYHGDRDRLGGAPLTRPAASERRAA